MRTMADHINIYEDEILKKISEYQEELVEKRKQLDEQLSLVKEEQRIKKEEYGHALKAVEDAERIYKTKINREPIYLMEEPKITDSDEFIGDFEYSPGEENYSNMSNNGPEEEVETYQISDYIEEISDDRVKNYCFNRLGFLPDNYDCTNLEKHFQVLIANEYANEDLETEINEIREKIRIANDKINECYAGISREKKKIGLDRMMQIDFDNLFSKIMDNDNARNHDGKIEYGREEYDKTTVKSRGSRYGRNARNSESARGSRSLPSM